MDESVPILRVMHPPGRQADVRVVSDPFTIGRRPGSDLVIAEADISRLQAEIRCEDGSYVLEDKASAFGTRVNGVAAARHKLRNRDVLTLGREGRIEIIFLHDDRMSRILRELDSRPQRDSSPGDYRNLSLLLEINKGFNSMTSLQDMLELTLDAILDVTRAERGFLLLKDPEGRLQLRAARNLAHESLEAEGLRFSQSIVAEVMERGELVYVADVMNDQQVRDRPSVVELSLRSVLCVPLKVPPADQVTRPLRFPDRSDVLGIIYADSPHAQGLLSNVTRELISSIAVQATFALENFVLRQEDLERRLVEREMEREMDRLRDMDRIKSEFLSNVSHELRTPLTAIKGSIENMVDGLTGEVNDRQRRYLARIAENAEQLSRLINDLLDLGRMEAGQLHLRPRSTSMSRLLEDAAESLRPLAEKRGIGLKVDPPREDIAVVADRDRLMQVLFNLMGNAVKFAGPGDSIELAARRQDDEMVVSVTDTGIGIPEKELERIFDRFYQVPSNAGAKTGGTGLGLPIARSLVELHGGRLWAERAEVGSRFLFTLPLQPSAPREDPKP